MGAGGTGKLRAPVNKHESIDLFARGCYGNNIPTYPDPCTAILVGDSDLFVIRYKGEPGVQGPAIFGIHKDDLIQKWEDLILKDGWDAHRLYINTSIPSEKIIFQGELSTGNWADREWLIVGCEESGIHMREAMRKSSFFAKGWRAKEYLRKHMHPSSWDDLNDCIDLWPDAIIELVIFDTAFGSLANTGRNCIIWECRGF